MLQAMNTGHDGSMTTVHANTSEEVIKRLEVLVLMAVDLPVVSIHRQIASALNVIVQITRLPAGRRAVTQISEVAGLDPDTHELIIHDIYNMRDGETLRPTGYLPTFVESLIHKNLLQLEFLYGRQPGNADGSPSRVPPAARPSLAPLQTTSGKG
jgi:pilus assembly protein CpaF